MKKSLLYCYIVILLMGYFFVGGGNLVWAAGTYSCKWVGGVGGSCEVIDPNSCTGGDRNGCSGLNNIQCIAMQNASCLPPVSTPTTAPPGGGVRTHPCTSGYGGQCLDTALGEIPVEPQELVSWILRWSVSMGGGIAFLLMVWGGFKILASGGNPEALNEGKEIISSAIAGLLLIIFSLVLLTVIGYDILGIPGFITP